MKRVSVFCGSSFGKNSIYEEQARLLGQTLANQNIELVYGGADVGLMGAIADGVLSRDGKVIGVLPKFLSAKEIEHKGLSELIIVDTMHERKAKMNDLCDGVITLPGGFGTLEEMFEMITWGQLSLHSKPIGVLNIAGFYDSLLQHIDIMIDQGFLKKENKEMVLVSDHAEELLLMMNSYKAKKVGKWISKN